MKNKNESGDADNIEKVTKALKEQIVELFHTEDQIPYAVVKGTKREEVYPIKSTELASFISKVAFTSCDLALSKYQKEIVTEYLVAEALYMSERKGVNIRIANLDDGVEIDLNNETGDCVFVRPSCWEIRKPKARFYRPKTMKTLPHPRSDGWRTVDFKKYFNVPDADSLNMIVAFAMYSFRPIGPYPILLLKGLQGSGKSTAMRLIKNIVDPAMGDGRGLPRGERELFVAAQQGQLLALDNLSHINPSFSDAFCRIATGGSYSSRKNYSDGEEYLIEVCKPVILNGIPDLATRADLINRCVSVELVEPDKRKDEESLKAEFEADLPKILGYLLDGYAGALEKLPHMSFETDLRLADFAKFVTAAEDALDWEGGIFQEMLKENQNAAAVDNVWNDPVANALHAFMSARADGSKEWRGTTMGLLEELQLYAGIAEKSQAWPKVPHYLSSSLKRLAPDLKKIGLSFEKLKRKSDSRGIKIKMLENFVPKGADQSTYQEVAANSSFISNYDEDLPPLFDDE